MPAQVERARPNQMEERFEAVRGLGAQAVDTSRITGAMGILLVRILNRFFRLQFDKSELLRNMYKMGVRSLPIIVITALFTGGIMIIQAAPLIKQYGAEGLLGWAAGFSTLREIGPILTALMLSGRVGANNTAELGTMVVTEQIDALRILAIDPIAFLLAPRFIAMVVTTFLGTIIADALALFGAAFAGELILDVAPNQFYLGLTGGLIGLGDLFDGLIKAVIFGAIMGLSSCHFGIATTGGATGVGRSVNATVVVTATGIFIMDYLVSFAMG